MKQHLKRLLALLLVLCLFPSCLAYAQEEGLTEPPTETETPTETEAPTETEEPDYVYPDDWSRPALMFAVENGILKGDENRQLNPDSNITRAEMAAVLVRMLGASSPADLSSYGDVAQSDWFYAELGAAVEAGIFNGTSATTMEPNAPLTREQAMTVISRAFGIHATQRQTYLSFSDGASVSSYARDAVSAMTYAGFVSGYEDQSLRPANPITRAEVAQLMYNIFSCIADTPQELPEQGYVLYRGTEPLPEELTLDGSLVIGQSAPTSIHAASWKITGTLAIRTGAGTQADLSGLDAAALTFAPLSGSVEANVPTVFLDGRTTFTGDSQILTILDGNHTVTGSTGVLTQRDGGYLIMAGDVRTSATLEDHTALVLRGNCPTLTAGAYVGITLYGSADSITLGKDCVLDARSEVKKLTLAERCTVTLAGDIDALTIDSANVHLTMNGTVKDLLVSGAYATVDGSGYAEKLTITSDSANVTLAYGDYVYAAIKTALVPCTTVCETKVFAENGGEGYLCTLPAGVTVYNEHWPGGTYTYVTLEDGTKAWVRRYNLYISDDNIIYDGEYDYSTEAKEAFVNSRGYESNTDYLIWISRYTQKVVIFTGSKGNWSVIRTCRCGSGAAETPTPEGVYSTFKRETVWNYGDYYVSDVTRFYGGHAFHSYLRKNLSQPYNSTLGKPISHGCIRLHPDDSAFIWDYIPLDTTVVVY